MNTSATRLHIPSSRDEDKFVVRLPDGMRSRVREAAERNARSMNSEIIVRIDDTFILEEEVRQLKATVQHLNLTISLLKSPELLGAPVAVGGDV